MTLSIKDTDELCRLCQEGMFIEVQEWVKSWKETVPDPATGKDPICISAGKGFHSLVKLLCSFCPTQATLDKALAAAVVGGNLETSRLLLKQGATVAAVEAKAVFRAPNVEILGVCVEAGVDLSKGSPLAIELINCSELALKFFERWHKAIKTVSDQGAMALVHLAREDEEHWVTRLIHAGASPRRRVPRLGPQYEIGPACTALEEAAGHGTFKTLLRMGVRKTDDPQSLLLETCWDFDIAKMKHILSRGAKLNDQDNGGSSLLQKCLWEMGTLKHVGLHERANLAWDAIVKLAEMGARWVPDTRELFVVRCGFDYLDFTACIQFAKIMLKEKAADHATLVKFFGSPKMRERFASYGKEEFEAVLGEQWWKPRRGQQ